MLHRQCSAVDKLQKPQYIKGTTASVKPLAECVMPGDVPVYEKAHALTNVFSLREVHGKLLQVHLLEASKKRVETNE